MIVEIYEHAETLIDLSNHDIRSRYQHLKYCGFNIETKELITPLDQMKSFQLGITQVATSKYVAIEEHQFIQLLDIGEDDDYVGPRHFIIVTNKVTKDLLKSGASMINFKKSLEILLEKHNTILISSYLRLKDIYQLI